METRGTLEEATDKTEMPDTGGSMNPIPRAGTDCIFCPKKRSNHNSINVNGSRRSNSRYLDTDTDKRTSYTYMNSGNERIQRIRWVFGASHFLDFAASKAFRHLEPNSNSKVFSQNTKEIKTESFRIKSGKQQPALPRLNPITGQENSTYSRANSNFTINKSERSVVSRKRNSEPYALYTLIQTRTGRVGQHWKHMLSVKNIFFYL